jgi:mono/diheme cytochrome c family protein
MWAALALLLTTGALAAQASADDVDFATRILPVIEARCVRCHGEARQKAGLRLDTRAAALAGSAFGATPVLVPGDAESSVLWQRIAHEDEEERMPPSGDGLTAEELDAFRQWIDAGAPWPDELAGDAEIEKHWAYVAPVPPELPATAADDPWVASPLDAFVSAGRGDLPPAPPAEPATLLRRVSLDLTGLPPTPEQVLAFEADPSEGAYLQHVERLLASPHYGEHQAAAWLDQARYADSHGYEKDDRRTMWRWRDWVIEAFNADKPFDEFTVEQLAGDLLPDPTLEQLIATGFHRNTMVNNEGGADPEEFRVAAVTDRVDTTATVWLGSSLGCARCHDHKYDPFKQREYYELYAFFNQSEDVGNSDAPRIDAPTPELAYEHERITAEIARLEVELATQTPQLDAELDAWMAERGRGVHWMPLRPDATGSEQGSRLAVLDDHSVLAFGDLPGSDTYEVAAHLPAGPARFTGLRLEVLTDESLPGGGPGRPSHQNFVLSELSVTWSGAGGGEGSSTGAGAQALPLASAVADFHQVGEPEWPAADVIDGDRGTGWAIAGGTGSPHQIVFAFAEPLRLDASGELQVRMEQAYGSGHLIGRFRLSLTTEDVSGPGGLVPPDVERALARLGTSGRTGLRSDDKHGGERGIGTNEQSGHDPADASGKGLGGERADEPGDERALVEDWFRGRAPSLAETRAQRAEIFLPRLPTALVMRDRDEPRETHVLERGSFLSPGEPVSPDVPAVLRNASPDGGTGVELPPGGGTRLDLARWLVSPRNPLTARVTVNRMWARLFGTGLVATEDDFGSQGEPPSHPELLDWLACEFQRSWSVKSLLRTVVTSSTYRQSSAASPEAWRDDPYNRLLARGPRLRVSGEGVRDVSLAASGLLFRKVGGPSVFPPQPAGTWAMTYSSDRWNESQGPDRYRRGMYTFWRRTAPYPTFQLFDAPSRELACTRRDRTNTPLQALATLNDPAFVECAVALAGRLLEDADQNVSSEAAADPEPRRQADLARIEHGYRLCVARAPTPSEAEVLLALVTEQRAAFAQDPEQAFALVPMTSDAPGLDTVELATWTVVANVLLNLDETLTKG